jgi:hypothetical protein
MNEIAVSKRATSAYGSHSSMIVKDVPLNGCLEMVVLEDDAGQYCTQRRRLDDGLADPNRYSSSKHRTELLAMVINEHRAVWKSVLDDAREGDFQN